VQTHSFRVPGIQDAQAAVALAHLNGPVGADTGLDGWLTGEEIERARRFRVDHARGDFLAGRIAAKSALQALVPASRPADWTLARGVWNQPCVRGPVAGISVTLAHSIRVGVAVAYDDRWKCGIDIEAADRDATEAIRSEVTQSEAAWADAGGDGALARWMMLWTAREALGKCLGTGLLAPGAIGRTVNWRRHADWWRADVSEGAPLAVHSLPAQRLTVSWAVPSDGAEHPAVAAVLDWLAARLEAVGG
jgi:4'-phosphopantetheinyl transferase EntD